MKQKSRPYSFPSDTKDLRATAAVADAAVADALWSKSTRGERDRYEVFLNRQPSSCLCIQKVETFHSFYSIFFTIGQRERAHRGVQ